MADLLNKINSLIRARVEGFLSDDLGLARGRSDRGSLSPDRLGKGIDREIAALRQRIDEALEREEQLKAQAAALRQEAADWDVKADNALLQKDDATARYAVTQMQRAEQRAAMVEADLAQHRRSTAELIDKVNVLEGLVADARRQQAQPPAAEPAPAPPQTEATLDSVLQTTRREIETLEAEEKRLADAQEQARQTVEQIRVDDDLSHRRQRLARRDTPPDHPS